MDAGPSKGFLAPFCGPRLLESAPNHRAGRRRNDRRQRRKILAFCRRQRRRRRHGEGVALSFEEDEPLGEWGAGGDGDSLAEGRQHPVRQDRLLRRRQK